MKGILIWSGSIRQKYFCESGWWVFIRTSDAVRPAKNFQHFLLSFKQTSFKSFFEDFYSMFLNCHVCNHSEILLHSHKCTLATLVTFRILQFNLFLKEIWTPNNIPKFQLNLWHERDSYLYFLESYINDLYNTEDLIKSPILSNHVEFWWDMEYVCIIVSTCLYTTYTHLCIWGIYAAMF